jgi:hypothetical protein
MVQGNTTSLFVSPSCYSSLQWQRAEGFARTGPSAMNGRFQELFTEEVAREYSKETLIISRDHGIQVFQCL